MKKHFYPKQLKALLGKKYLEAIDQGSGPLHECPTIKKAVERIQKYYSWDDVTDKYEKLFGQVTSSV